MYTFATESIKAGPIFLIHTIDLFLVLIENSTLHDGGAFFANFPMKFKSNSVSLLLFKSHLSFIISVFLQ